MTSFHQKIEVELDNIKKTLKELPGSHACERCSRLELGGVGALLHNIYNGIEQILIYHMKYKKISMPKGPSWHRDLINIAVKNRIIENSTAQIIKQYLAFRHFFIHSYVIHLEAERLEPLLNDVDILYNAFLYDITDK
jgi:uncharacterized protein YutE (UPF0331/DUF86 family)